MSPSKDFANEFKKSCLDHVAVAVKDLSNAQKIYSDLGLTFHDSLETIESEQVTVAFAQIDKNTKLELLQPLNNQGPIQKFIKNRGEGIHHLCFRVDDVVQKSQELKEKGYNLIYDDPINGANGCLINFVHPKSTGGVLIEISQKAK